MSRLFKILILTLFVNTGFSQTDTLYLSLEDCLQLSARNNYAIKIAGEQTKLTENLQKSARTQYFGRFNLLGRYQYSNKQFQLLGDNLFIPVVPFWAIDQESMDLNSDIMDNPLYHGIVTNPITGEVYTDPEGNPLFFLYSYLPAEHIQFGHSHNFVFGPGFVQPIYLGGKIRNLNNIADAGVEIAKSKKSLEINETYYEVSKTCWQIVDLSEKKKLIDAYLDFLDLMIYDLENIFEEGIITYHDVLTAKQKKNELELNKIKIENGLELAELYLKHLLVIEQNTKIILTQEPDDIPLLTHPETIVKKALQSREELKIIDLTHNIALSQKAMAKSRFLPNISFSANYLFMNPNPYAGFTNNLGHDYSVGLSLNIPLFSWGDRLHTLRASENLITITNLQKKEAESLLKLELHQIWQQYIETLKIYELNKKSKELAMENLKLHKDLYEEGMITVRELIEYRTKYYEAETNIIETLSLLKQIEADYHIKSGATINMLNK